MNSGYRADGAPVRMMAFVLVLTIGAATNVHADPVPELTEFIAGTTARAADVNENFASVSGAVNDNDARIAALEATTEMLATNIAALEDDRAALRSQLDAVLNIAPFLSLETVNGEPAVRISGANLQIVNGDGVTASANGTGNLIVGYDEQRPAGSPSCSLGTNPISSAPITNETGCTSANGVWALNHKSGSHYIIVGPEHNYSRWGGFVAAMRNTSNFDFGSVSGGIENTASGLLSSVSGGRQNEARGESSSISGGSGNLASGLQSSVSGGSTNLARGTQTSIAGGLLNSAGGGRSTIGGGYANETEGATSSISGGSESSAGGASSSISGGRNNVANGDYASVSGGVANRALQVSSSVTGGARNTASGNSATVSGGLDREADGPGEWVAGSLRQDN